jgi:hypothetical protein
LEHFYSVAEGGKLSILFMGRPSGGNEPDLVEVGLLAAVFGDDQVHAVNRIKRAAEDANPHH